MTQGRTFVATAVVVASMVGFAGSAAAKGEPTLTDREEVVFRTSPEGVTLRVVTGEGESFGTPGACDGPGCLPKQCQPVRAGYLAASTRRTVGEGYFDVYRRQPDEPIALVSAGSFGGIVERPVGWVVVRVSPEVERVDATFVDGGRDSVEPVDGWAVVASPLAPSTNAQGQMAPARLVACDGDGARAGRIVVRSDMSPWPGPPESCGLGGLPQTFPKVTGREPADPAAAETAIVEAFGLVYGGAPGVDALSYVDDGEALREVTEVATERYPQYAGTISASVSEVRFVDDDEAAVRFEVDVPGLGTGVIPGGIGTAVLRDGTWLVARETFCSMLAAGAVYCPLPSDASAR